MDLEATDPSDPMERPKEQRLWDSDQSKTTTLEFDLPGNCEAA